MNILVTFLKKYNKIRKLEVLQVQVTWYCPSFMVSFFSHEYINRNLSPVCTVEHLLLPASISLSSTYFFFQIMGYKIYTHEIHSSYAARIDNYRSYDTISKDIIQRWTYPLVPDVQFFGNFATKLERQGMYRAPGKDQFHLIFSLTRICCQWINFGLTL